ncbi:MAG: UDP-glucuronic acid decarboxylase family protein [Paenibacillaceae bacterium]
MSSKRVLITGGAGFIGSHLCQRILMDSNEVICLDNYFTASRANLVGLMNHPHFERVRHDVTEPMNLEVDEIYNLACPASPIHYQKNPIKTTKTSVLGAIHVLDLANELKVKVLHASTSEVYGDPLVHPQGEDYWGNVNPVGMRSCYDEGKRCAETLFFDYARQYGLDIKVIRIFNTYGPNMNLNDGRVVSNFIVQALKGEDITIYGDGTQSRSFCYIDDLIDGIMLMMNTEVGCNGPLNLGNPMEFTVLELAEKVLSLIDSKSRLIFCPLPQDDPKRRCPNIERAHDQLGWQPKVSLEDGLKETIDYFKKLIF